MALWHQHQLFITVICDLGGGGGGGEDRVTYGLLKVVINLWGTDNPGMVPNVRPLKKNQRRTFYYFFMYVTQLCFICRPSDSSVSEDAGIELRPLALTASRCKLSARSQPHTVFARCPTVLCFGFFKKGICNVRLKV